jgi:hypothetical protein
MLYILTNNGNEFPWWVDKKVPIIPTADVQEIQADGDELDHLKAEFPTFPWPTTKPVVRVFGESARYIYGNM